MRPLLPWIPVALLLGLPSMAHATYSPPLTRVRIDANQLSHTPNLVYASERKTNAAADLELKGLGAQYILQLERDFGFGVQAGVAIGYADVDGTVGQLAFGGLPVETGGYWLGGQLRVYQMLWKSEVDEQVTRPSAVTAFLNVRTLFYDTSGDGSGEQADLRFFTVTGGLGAMAEISVSDYVSICPYAWLTPGVTAKLDYTVRNLDFDADVGLTLRNPLLVGVDVWIYPFPPNWQDHIALSILGSFIDTEGDDRTIAFSIGWTF